jgi:hypothetical protein
VQPQDLDDLFFAEPLPLHRPFSRTDPTLLRVSFRGAGQLVGPRNASFAASPHGGRRAPSAA